MSLRCRAGMRPIASSGANPMLRWPPELAAAPADADGARAETLFPARGFLRVGHQEFVRLGKILQAAAQIAGQRAHQGRGIDAAHLLQPAVIGDRQYH